MPKTVTAFLTKDGKLFLTEAAATDYENKERVRIQLDEWACDTFCNYDNTIGDITRAITEDIDILIEIFKGAE